MKKIRKGIMGNISAAVSLPLIAAVSAASVFFLTACGSEAEEVEETEAVTRVTAIFTSPKTTEATTAAMKTTTETAVVTTSDPGTTADETTEAAPESDSDSGPVYSSSNSEFYHDRLAIVGDSVTYGFNTYGFIPDHHNISSESLAITNIDNYTFDLGGGEMSLYNAVAYADAPMYYLAIGMNDLFTFDPDTYAERLIDIAYNLRSEVPTAVIIIATISPVAEKNYFTTNERIDDYNAALEEAVKNENDPKIILFDTNSVLKTDGNDSLYDDYAAPDGLHLNSSAYFDVLDALYTYLDNTDVIEMINIHENQ